MTTLAHELFSFEEKGALPKPLLQGAVDALEEALDLRDHRHPHLALLRFNDLGGAFSPNLQLPTLIVDDQLVQQPIEGDANAVACPRQHLRLSHVLQLKEYCKDSRQRAAPYRLDAIRKAKASSLSTPAQAAQTTAGPKSLGLSIAAISRKGYAPGYKEDNQDRCMVVQPFVDNNQVLFGVMDGHGIEGHRVAEYIKSSLPGVMRGHLLVGGLIPHKAYINTFHEVDSLVCNSSGIDAENSGSTAVLGLLQGKKLTTAWVGDSRGILGYYKPTGQGGKMTGWKAKELSVDHKPENDSERRRILMCKGRVERTRNRQGQATGCHRVWLPHANYPGLAMSRAIGDTVVRPFGVTCTPETTTHKLGARDCFLVFASDGVWEYLSNQEVAELVGKHVGYAPEKANQGKPAWHLKWQEQQEKRREEQRQKQEEKQRQHEAREQERAAQQRQKQEQKAQQQRQKEEQEAARKLEQERQKQEQEKQSQEELKKLQQKQKEEQKQREAKQREEQKQREQKEKEEQKQREAKEKEEQKQREAKQKEEQKQREAKQREEKAQQEAKQREEQKQREAKQKEEQKQREAKQREEKAQQEAKQKEEQKQREAKQKEEQKQREQREQQRRQEEQQQQKQREQAKQKEEQRQREAKQKEEQQRAEHKQQREAQEEQHRQQRQEFARAWLLRLQQIAPELRPAEEKKQEQERAEQQQRQARQQQELQRQQRQQQEAQRQQAEEAKRKQQQQQQEAKQREEQQKQREAKQREEQRQREAKQREEQKQREREEKQRQKEQEAERKRREPGPKRSFWRFWRRGRESEAEAAAQQAAVQGKDARDHWGKQLMDRVPKLGSREGEAGAGEPSSAQQQSSLSAREHDAAAMRACAALVSEARSRWEKSYEGQYIDDISAVVVLLHEQTNQQHQQQQQALQS